MAFGRSVAVVAWCRRIGGHQDAPARACVPQKMEACVPPAWTHPWLFGLSHTGEPGLHVGVHPVAIVPPHAPAVLAWRLTPGVSWRYGAKSAGGLTP